MSERKEQIRYFSSEGDGMMVRIIICAVVFHMVTAGICIGIHFVNFKQEPEPIPVFEMVQVQQPTKARPRPPRPKPPEIPPDPPKEQPKPDVKPKPEPKPKVNKELPPDIKPEEEKKPEPEPEEKPEPQPEPEPEPEPVDDFDVDDLDLPAAVEAPSLNPVGSVDMDPLMQVYLEQLKRIIMANFNPPNSLSVKKSVKTTVQFTIDRFGGITGITLKRSSGNKTWDHLSVRAVSISKAPELPLNFRAPSLTLHFNFTPN